MELNYILHYTGAMLVALAGVFESICDTLVFRYSNSMFKFLKNQNYWNPQQSWVNKYKPDLKTPKFPFSTTILVFLTDGWHFMKFIRNKFLFLGFSLLVTNGINNIWVNAVIGLIIYQAWFEIGFRFWKIKKFE